MFNRQKILPKRSVYSENEDSYISNATIEQLAFLCISNDPKVSESHDPKEIAYRYTIAYKAIKKEVTHLKKINFT